MLEPKVAKRFWSKVDKTSSEHGCWLWTGCTNNGKHGQFKCWGKLQYAHRVSWVIHNGRHVPEGMQVMHNCPGSDNPRCVNPAHLGIGTPAEHQREKVEKGQLKSGDESWSANNPEKLARGKRHGMYIHHVTDYEKTVIIPKLYHEQKMSFKAIAKQFNVSAPWIKFIVFGFYIGKVPPR